MRERGQGRKKERAAIEFDPFGGGGGVFLLFFGSVEKTRGREGLYITSYAVLLCVCVFFFFR